MIPFPANSLVKVRRGMATLRSVCGTTDVWDGQGHTQAVISPAEDTEFSMVVLDSGFEFYAHPDLQMLVYGKDQYYWKSVVRLEEGDRICAGLPDGNQTFLSFKKALQYWLGKIFFLGEYDGKSVVLEIPRNQVFAAEEVFSKIIKCPLEVEHSDTFARITFIPKSEDGDIDFLGKWVKHSNRMLGVPLLTMISSVMRRRIFCKGVIESCGKAKGRFWEVQLGTYQRAHDMYRMLLSCGVDSEIVGASTLKVNKWTASLDLDTPTDYPTEEEIGRYAVTEAVLEEFIDMIETKRIISPRKFECQVFLGVLYKRYIRDPTLPVCPYAIRAARKSVEKKGRLPAYDGVCVENVEPLLKKLGAVYVNADQIEVDGFITSGV